MNGWAAWLAVIAAGLVTLAIRASFIVLPPDTRLPGWLQSGLRYVGAAVLPALIVPGILFADLPAGATVNFARIAAALVAIVVALRTKSVFATLIAGMAVMLLLKWWLGY